jgi:dienelactone hydrolase
MKKMLVLTIGLALFAIFACDTPNGDILENPGTFKVYKQSLKIKDPLDTEITATVYGPSLDGGKSIATGKYPLVIMMPGFSASYTMYYDYTRHLVSWGYAVIGIDFPHSGSFDTPDHERNAKEVSITIDFADSDLSPLAGKLDMSKIAVAGHSKGGKIGFYAAALDHRIKAVMAMDPQNTGGAPCFTGLGQCRDFPVAPNPTHGIAGMMDHVAAASVIFIAPPDPLITPEEEFNAHYFYDGLTSNALGIHLKTGHLQWLTSAKIKRITKRTMIAWLKKHFNGDPGMEKYFTGSVIQEDVADGVITRIETK